MHSTLLASESGELRGSMWPAEAEGLSSGGTLPHKAVAMLRRESAVRPAQTVNQQ